MDIVYYTTKITEVTEDTEILIFFPELFSADLALSALNNFPTGNRQLITDNCTKESS